MLNVLSILINLSSLTKDKNETLIFPTGKFVSVYYSEEFQFAQSLGYKIIPIRGYLFENVTSTPFDVYITESYEKRVEAKNRGDRGLELAYKMMMNSLYGRLGINPESTITIICKKEKYESMLKKRAFFFNTPLGDEYILAKYFDTKQHQADTTWKQPRISAVQISAAITACARIYMYPFTSRGDCYYTDTDSVILGSPLEDKFISSTELGKFKQEYFIKKGYFLAPKLYAFKHDKTVEPRIVCKGAGKASATFEWFEEQYNNLKRIIHTEYQSYFSIDWCKMNIMKKLSLYNLATLETAKRKRIIYENNKWVDTNPVNVIDLDGHDYTVVNYINKELQKEKVRKKNKER